MTVATRIGRYERNQRRSRRTRGQRGYAAAHINMRHVPLDFNTDYAPETAVHCRCGAFIEGDPLEDQEGRPACSEACAQLPLANAPASVAPFPRVRSEPPPSLYDEEFDARARGQIAAGRLRPTLVDYYKRRLRAVPEVFTLAPDPAPTTTAGEHQ